MKDIPQRRALVTAMRDLARNGLNVGTSGNASLRVPEGLLISPSGVPPASLRPGDIPRLDREGIPQEGAAAPSSEWRCHRDILAGRPEIQAVVHVHSPCATALACLRRPIPAFHYLVALAGGSDVPVAEYATFGTQELSDNVLEALKDRRACLMANHGLLGVGEDLSRAVALVREMENLARQYLLALQTGEEPVRLTSEEMAEVARSVHRYTEAASRSGLGG